MDPKINVYRLRLVHYLSDTSVISAQVPIVVLVCLSVSMCVCLYAFQMIWVCVQNSRCKKVIWPRNLNGHVNSLEAEAKELIITQVLYIVDANVLINPWYLNCYCSKSTLL